MPIPFRFSCPRYNFLFCSMTLVIVLIFPVASSSDLVVFPFWSSLIALATAFSSGVPILNPMEVSL